MQLLQLLCKETRQLLILYSCVSFSQDSFGQQYVVKVLTEEMEEGRLAVYTNL